MLSTASPTPFPIPFANSAGVGYIRTIPTASQIGITAGAASLTDGFPPLNFLPVTAGGVPPFGQDMNGVLNEITAAIQWQQAGGLPVYNSTFQTAIGGYPNGAALLNSNGNGFWISTVDNNLTNPNTGGAGWKNLSGTYLDKSVAGAVDVTLTVLEATYAILDLTGVLTGNINVIVPSVGNKWIIRNSTTGAFTINVKTAAGTGVIVAQGSSVELYSDGVNVYSASQPQTGVVAGFRNLLCYVPAASTSATFTADEVIVKTSLGGQSFIIPSLNKTINVTTIGAGGMDVGSAPISGYVAIYVIYNPNTATSNLLAVNATSAALPNIYGGAAMPAGYTASALISVWPTNASGQLVVADQRDRKISFPLITVLTTSTMSAPYVSVNISSAVPANAISCSGNNSLQSTSTSGIILSIASDTNGIQAYSYSNAASTVFVTYSFELFLLTSQTIYRSSQNSAGTPTQTIAINSYTI